MKKLERKTLDELAKIMPVITEEEQGGIVGAVKFYNYSGLYLGSLGSSDELRFVDGYTTFGDIVGCAKRIMAPGSEETLKAREESASLNIGSDWSSTSEAARRNFVITVVNSESALSALRGFEFIDNWNSGSSPAETFIENETGQIILGISGKQAFFGSYSSALSTLVHESYHAQTGSGMQLPISGVITPDENGAYSHQVNGPYYSQTSKQYKLELARGACTNGNWEPGTPEMYKRIRLAAILFGVPESEI